MVTRLGGRYQLVREIGGGGQARVYQAVDTETGRSVAAKVMLATGADNFDALLRFQQEGALLSTLKHPNIVEVFGTFIEGETSYIIMELLEGQSLSQILHVERLPLNRTKKLAEQVTSGLAYAHGRGIVHRDVKPNNIMVIGNDHVKVTDFGIARILRQGVTLNTVTGMSIGTPLYMAPEQIEGLKVDARADIYSLGAVLYQMVTGRPPFEGEDPLTIAFKHVHKAPQPPSEVGPAVPLAWEAIILKALAKDPAERFQTAGDLYDAIAALPSDERDAAEPAVQPIQPVAEPPVRPAAQAAGVTDIPTTAPRQPEPAVDIRPDTTTPPRPVVQPPTETQAPRPIVETAPEPLRGDTYPTIVPQRAVAEPPTETRAPEQVISPAPEPEMAPPSHASSTIVPQRPPEVPAKLEEPEVTAPSETAPPTPAPVDPSTVVPQRAVAEPSTVVEPREAPPPAQETAPPVDAAPQPADQTRVPGPRPTDHTIVPPARQPETVRPAAVDETAMRPAAQVRPPVDETAMRPAAEVRAPMEDTAIRPAAQVAPETASPPQTVEAAAGTTPTVAETAQKQKEKSQPPSTVKTAPPVATRVAMRQPQTQSSPLPIIGGAIAAALIVVVAVFAFLHFRPTTHHAAAATATVAPTAAPSAVPTTTAAALQIAAVKPRHGKTFASGSKISLRWTKVKNAVYHLEITTDPARTVAQSFRHPLTSIQTKKSSYSFKVEGKRTYLSRVQAKIGGKWGSFSKVQKFPVAAPKIGKALLKTPRNGKSQITKHSVAIGLCWYKVPGAQDYLLSVSGHRTLKVHGTCHTVRVGPRPAAYRWHVAAQVRAASLYTGPSSPVRAFSLHMPKAQPTAVPTTVVQQATATPQPVQQATATPIPVQQPTATPIPVQQPTATPIPVQPTAVPQATKCDPSYQVC